LIDASFVLAFNALLNCLRIIFHKQNFLSPYQKGRPKASMKYLRKDYFFILDNLPFTPIILEGLDSGGN